MGQHWPGRTYWEVVRGPPMRPLPPLGFSKVTVRTHLCSCFTASLYIGQELHFPRDKVCEVPRMS